MKKIPIKQGYITPIPTLTDNYVWAIVNERDRAALIIDPGEAKKVDDFLKSQALRLSAILITHHHWDHTNGIQELVSLYHVPVYGPQNKSIASITHPVSDQDAFSALGFQYKVVAIPGHTLDHIAYQTDGHFFCGDTLFAAGCGRVFEGTAEQMYESLQKIAALPTTTHLYCAHEYTANNLRFAEMVEPDNDAIKKRLQAIMALRNEGIPSLPSILSDELATNPFLRCESPTILKQVETYAKKNLTTPIEVFTWLRKWKDTF